MGVDLVKKQGRDDCMVKQLRGKEIPLVKVVWGSASNKDATWELEGTYPTLFDTGKFQGQNFF